jgi:hypothetical protein
MTSVVLWCLVAAQLAVGLFDIVYHHEMTERLAWRPSQRHELVLHVRATSSTRCCSSRSGYSRSTAPGRWR